eukprot:5772056-Lingulodinium_polyedra.AAC.1
MLPRRGPEVSRRRARDNRPGRISHCSCMRASCTDRGPLLCGRASSQAAASMQTAAGALPGSRGRP